MPNAVICFGNSPNAVPYLASLGDEVVVGIDHEQCSGLPLVCNVWAAQTYCAASQALPATMSGAV
jgi:hypothetical protein